MGLSKEFWLFLKKEKKWWLVPMIEEKLVRSGATRTG